MLKTDLEYFRTKGISNSTLSLIEKDVKEFKKAYEGIVEDSKEQHFIIGSAVHCAVLEPKEFDDNFLYFDYTPPRSVNQKNLCEDYAQSPVRSDDKKIALYKKHYSAKGISDAKSLEEFDEIIKENKQYIKYLKLGPNKAVLSLKSRDMIDSIKNAIKGHETASKLLYNEYLDIIEDKDYFVKNEIEIYWEDKDKVPYKSKIDRLFIDFKQKVVRIIDLKTTSHINNFTKAIEDFNYIRQLAFYKIAIYNLFKQKFPDKNLEEYEFEYYLIPVDKNNYGIVVYKIKESTILQELEEIYRLLARAKWHILNDKWDYYMEYYTNGGVIEL